MERTSVMRSVPQIEAQIARFKQAPRPGQESVLRELKSCGSSLNIKLPTGYGKTFTGLAAYSVLASLGEVNRLLVIFPTDAQLIQFEESAALAMGKCDIKGPKSVCDIRFFGAEAIKKHQENKCQVFAITIQSLIGARGMDNVAMLLQKGRWMIVVDEYHHYGVNLPFGDAVSGLNREFLLCMSATPYRPGEDSAFGSPSVVVTYREAVEEKAVKPLNGHSYNYRVDAINADNEVISFTTEELIAEAGDDSAKKIEKMIYDRKLRWSPKYISPLVTNPIERMVTERIKSGYKLQAIIGAMCVSHAEMVCDQIRAAFPDLVCEWVGTGDDGRSAETNRKIIKQFSPTDDTAPTIDVLVHVGMAGEGLDTKLVSEIVHLNAASVNNTNNQENGRAARYIDGVVGNINFDAGSGYAKKGYVGLAIMDAMDNLPPQSDPCSRCKSDPCECDPSKRDGEFNKLPDLPTIRIINAECISIDSGDVGVQNMAKQLVSLVRDFTADDLKDDRSKLWEYAIHGVKMMRSQEAELLNEKSVILQWEDSVKGAMTATTGNVIGMMTLSGTRVEKSMIGDIKKRINTRKKRDIGSAERTVQSLKKHYQWIASLNNTLAVEGLPLWLR